MRKRPNKCNWATSCPLTSARTALLPPLLLLLLLQSLFRFATTNHTLTYQTYQCLARVDQRARWGGVHFHWHRFSLCPPGRAARTASTRWASALRNHNALACCPAVANCCSLSPPSQGLAPHPQDTYETIGMKKWRLCALGCGSMCCFGRLFHEIRGERWMISLNAFFCLWSPFNRQIFITFKHCFGVRENVPLVHQVVRCLSASSSRVSFFLFHLLAEWWPTSSFGATRKPSVFVLLGKETRSANSLAGQ